MGSFTLPDPTAGASGTPIADLVDKLIAAWKLEDTLFDTSRGKRQGIRAQVFELQINGPTVVDLVDQGDCIFWQEVLIEKLGWHNPHRDGWYVARIVKPKSAYLFARPAEDEVPAIVKAVDMLDQMWTPPVEPEPEPAAPGPEPEPPDEEAPF